MLWPCSWRLDELVIAARRIPTRALIARCEPTVTGKTGRLLRRMSPVVARSGPPAMSAVRSLSREKRTAAEEADLAAFDPKRTWPCSGGTLPEPSLMRKCYAGLKLRKP